MGKRALCGWFLLVLAACALAACGPDATPPPPAGEAPASDLIQAEPWPEADALFRSNAKWLGSDDAYSVDLGGGRTLWLFGDTFISRSFLNTRRLSTMIRNSVAIQSGSDPATATMDFAWRTEKGKPRSFFPEEGETWFWPAHGIRVEETLILFMMATRSSSEGLGFEHVRWRAVSIPNPKDPPAEWDLNWLDTPGNAFGLIVSGGVIREGDHILAFSLKEPEHTIHLVRWPVAEVSQADLSRPQWWDGEEQGWVRQEDLAEVPQALFAEGHTEFTVHYEPRLGRYLAIQTVGFGPSDLGYRLAGSPQGPWTPIERFYRPEEYGEAGILIYAAKAHPQLEGTELVLTYATNTVGYGELVGREDVYYPRFLRMGFGEEGDERSP